jgi:hypothetical protein
MTKCSMSVHVAVWLHLEWDTSICDVDGFKGQGKHYNPEESYSKKYDVNELTKGKVQRVPFIFSLNTADSIVQKTNIG